ncbi:MAG: hypothetical protein WB586_22125 [Chthoniobacterales bacterium]
MRSQIEKLIIAMPFCPFVVELDGDLKYEIADPKRAFATGNFLVIEDVNGDVDLIPYGQRRVQVRQDREETKGPIGTLFSLRTCLAGER